MKKLILVLTMIGAIAMGEYTREELESAVERKLTQDEETLMKFLAPVSIHDGYRYTTALVATAWLVTPLHFQNYPVPPDAVARVYGDPSLNVQLKDFSISNMVLSNDRFAFMLSGNYNLSPKPPCRDTYTSASDVMDWLPYIEALGGYSIADLMTTEEFNEYLNQTE